MSLVVVLDGTLFVSGVIVFFCPQIMLAEVFFSPNFPTLCWLLTWIVFRSLQVGLLNLSTGDWQRNFEYSLNPEYNQTQSEFEAERIPVAAARTGSYHHTVLISFLSSTPGGPSSPLCAGDWPRALQRAVGLGHATLGLGSPVPRLQLHSGVLPPVRAGRGRPQVSRALRSAL